MFLSPACSRNEWSVHVLATVGDDHVTTRVIVSIRDITRDVVRLVDGA